jgi:hypothetical protein
MVNACITHTEMNKFLLKISKEGTTQLHTADDAEIQGQGFSSSHWRLAGEDHLPYMIPVTNETGSKVSAILSNACEKKHQVGKTVKKHTAVYRQK